VRLPKWLMPHSVEVQTYLGATGTGVEFADSVPVRCRIEYGVRAVLDAKGNEVISSARLFCAPEDLEKMVPESMVAYGVNMHRVLTARPQVGLMDSHAVVELQ